jgi:hypothetical protein
VDKFWPTLIIVFVLALVFLAMWWGWRRRSTRDDALRAEHTLPQELGAQRCNVDVFYVATTEYERALERLAVRGLSFPGRARVTVADAGIVLAVTGERATFVPASAIVSVSAATVAIDRVVESDGLVRLSWRIAGPTDNGNTVVDSYLRTVDPGDRAPLLDAITAISSFSPDHPAASAANDPESEV